METGIPFVDNNVLPWLVRIALAVLIFLAGRWLSGKLSRVFLNVLLKSHADSILAKFIGQLCYGFLLMAFVLAALDQVGVDISSLLALIGAAGLAVGLALKDSLSNFAAGVMIVIFRPFKSGDTITAGGQTGVVDEIGMFSTMLNTFDNQRIFIPNSTIIGNTIVNSTTLPTRRIDLALFLGPDDNLVTAKRVIDEVLRAEPRILANPPCSVGVDKIGPTNIELFVRAWVNTPDFGVVKADLQERLKLALDAAGILLPTRPVPVLVQNVTR